MLQRAACFLLLFVLAGCTARPLYRHAVDGNEAFKKKLIYSRNLFSQPIDILEADSVFVFAPNRSRASVAKREIRAETNRRGGYAVQIASFSKRENARYSQNEAQKQYPDLSVSILQYQGLWRVVIGFYDDRGAANRVLQRLRTSGKQDAWIFTP